MAGLLDFFNTSTDEDLYGGLLSPEQRSGLAGRSLAAMAEKFGQLAMPQRAPIPLGAILGQGFGAYGAGNDEAVKTLFEGLLRQQQVGDLKSKARARDLFTQILQRAGDGSGGGTPQGAASLPSIQGPLAAPATGGGGAAGAGGVPAKGLGGLLLPEIKSTDLGGDDSGTSRFPDLGIEYPATDPSGLKAGGALRRQASATPSLSADLAPYQSGGLLAPQPADLPQLANYAVGNAVPGGASPITGVAPQMSNRLEAMLAGMPPDVLQKFNVLSGYRSPERQAVVNPGVTNSRHTAGTAVDTTTDPAVLDWVRQNGPQYGVGYTLAGTPGEENHLEMLGAGGGRAPAGLPVQLASAGGPLTGSAWEIANNNFGGMRRPGVNATPSQGGFQTFGSPAEGIAAISRQLDRYASGATTGTPLTTIRQIVSTWAPPSENDTPTLIRRASQVVGVDPDTPLDVSNPAVKAKLIEATIRNEQGGRLPVPADLISQVASAPGAVAGGPDTVVPTGDRPSLPVQRTQYAPAPGGLLAAPAQPAAPGGPGLLTPQGKIPGFNLTPAEAARANALADIAGLGKPFESILETYYKSPEYLRDAAGAGEAGKLPYVGPRTTLEEQAKEPYRIAASDRELKNALIKEGWQLDDKGNAIPVPNYNTIAEAKANAIALGQQGPALDSALAQQGKQRVYDSQGRVMIIPITGAAEADARAKRLEEEAKAPTTRETARQAQADIQAREEAVARYQATGLDPIRARNEVLKDEYKTTVVEPFNAAQKALVPLAQIENATANFQTGRSAPTRLALQASWQDFANSLGLPPNSQLAKEIASGEIINKSGTALGFDLARTLGSREAQNIVQQAIAANPGLSISPTGNKDLIGLIRQGLQRDIDKREFVDKHFNAYGTYDGATTAFNRAAPIEKYVSQVLPYSVTTPADAAKLPPGTRFTTKDDPPGTIRVVPGGR